VVRGSGEVWWALLRHRADLWFMYVPSDTMLLDNELIASCVLIRASL